MPVASSAPVIPESTSPVPAVACHGVPVPLTKVVPSGPATTVASPLSRTTHARPPPSRRVARIRSGPTPSPPAPPPPAAPKRANSRSCGVSTVGAPRCRTSAGSRASIVRASASTIAGRSVASTSASTLRASSSVPIPGPTTQLCTRPASRGRPSVTIASGQAARTPSAAGPAEPASPGRVAGGGPGVAAQPWPGAQRGPREEDGGPRVGRRAGDDPDDALRVLVVVRRRRPEPVGEVGVGELVGGRAWQVGAEPDVDEVQPAGTAAALPHDQTDLDRPEGDRVHGGEGGALDRAGAGVDPAGDVHGDGERRTGRRLRGQRCRLGPQPARAPD